MIFTKFIRKILHFFRVLRYKMYFYKSKVIGRGSIIISSKAIVPKSTVIRVSAGGQIIIGKNVELRENVILNATNGGVIELKDNVFLNDYVCLNARQNIVINSGVQIGQGAKLYDHDHDYLNENFKYEFRSNSIYIGEHTWIGADVVILRGSIIGKRCVIGASSLFKGKLSDNTMFYNKRMNVEKKYYYTNN